MAARGQSRAAGEAGGRAELFLDAQQLIVFSDAIGAGSGAGLDLSCPHSNDEIGDEGVFGLAATMRNDGRVSGAAGHLDSFDGLGNRSDLIELNKDGIADVFGN